ncbi:MAG: Transcriptional regulator [uncultured Frankineae bacterium]|uniref:Transcriptional regulator n=1 Tax=uncultured Frankineae bacterium TaxID=437475 RepID=A0A6J4LMZ8_9ACTN|nr:MAG: Transcriptional regulator [uncultured Frankineae bacterium]
MQSSRPGDLEAVDEALVRLRRLWTASRAHVLDELGERVEMSSVLVVEACARTEAAGAGAEVTVGDVAVFLDVDPSTASRLVERAARAGLVHRTPSSVDGRRAALVLTPSGRALRARAASSRRAWLGAVVADWPDEEVLALARLLHRFSAAVSAAPGPAAALRSPGADGPAPGR